MKKSEVRLTQLASAAGCGAKIGPKVLAQVVGKLPKFTDPMLLVGPETSDDAAVYKINDELAMIHTVDFFPPVVDDPYMYGLRKGIGGAQRFPQNGRKPFEECKGRRELDCDTDGWSRYESRA